MRNIALFILIAFLFLGCNDHNGTTNITQNEIDNWDDIHPGKSLTETQCYVCHGKAESHEGRLAPPMIAVKRHYIENATTKDDFTKDLKSWLANPNEANAKMYGAVRRFGVMPKISISDADIEQIADYIYSADIEAPHWFNEHHKQKKKRHGKF